MALSDWKTPSTVLGIVGALTAIAALYLSNRETKASPDSLVATVAPVNNGPTPAQQQVIDDYNKRLGEIDEQIENCRHQIGAANVTIRHNVNNSAEAGSPEWEEARVEQLAATNVSKFYTNSWKELIIKREQIAKEKADFVAKIN